MREREIKLLEHQEKFLDAKEKFVLLCTGIGGGKTFAGAHYVIKKCFTDGKALGFICANTYKQLRTSTLSALFRELDSINCPFKHNENKGILEIFGSQIICRSLENFQDIRGIEIGWVWGDEIAYAKREAFEVLIGRLRDNRCKMEGRFTSTPKGFNWMYDYWSGDKKTDEFKLITASSRNNIFLPKGYIETLAQSYDSKLIEQEVEGKFTNITSGKIYYAFEDKNIGECNYNYGQPVWIGMDFNVNPMTAVIGHVYGEKQEEQRIEIFDEVHIMSSNTHEVGQFIKEKYRNSPVNIIPDATGKAIKTSSGGLSDHDILRGYFGNNSVKQFRNPFRVDRYNCLNNCFDKGKIKISPKCKHLINDLRKVSYKEGTTFPDTNDKLAGHLSDGLGYYAYYLFGVERKPVRVGYYA